MREALAILAGSRIDVQATVLRRSTRPGWAGAKQPTVLLGEVRSTDGALLADHLWLVVGRRLGAINPQPGDLLAFSGRVRPYLHRHSRSTGEVIPGSEDFTLAFPSRCIVLSRAPQAPVPGQESQPPAKLLATIRTLWQQEGRPPALARVCQQSGLRPWQALAQAHELAHAGAILFSPTGCVFPTRVLEVAS
jgi:hypothetical protein